MQITGYPTLKHIFNEEEQDKYNGEHTWRCVLLLCVCVFAHARLSTGHKSSALLTAVNTLSQTFNNLYYTWTYCQSRD